MIFAKRLKFGKPLFISLHRGLIHFNGGNRPKSNNLPVKLISNDPSSVRDAIKILESSSDDMEIDTYTQLLEACIQSKSITEGKKIHRHILEKKTHISNYTLLEKLTYLYVTCGEIDLARKVFDQIPRPNIILWNLLIRGYAWNGPFDEAIDLFYRMIDVGIRPNKFTFPVVLKACSGLEAVEDGKEIHLHVNRLGLHSDVYICTALVDFYAKCGCLSEAHTVFDKMQNRDVVSWNSIISGHSLHGLYEDAMKLVFKMQIAGVSPNFSTIVSILPAVGQAKALNQGKGIHGYCVRRDFGKDVQAGTALLDMYGKCNRLTYARRVFDLLGTKNEVTWSAIIGAYVLCDHSREALTLFDKMLCDENVNLSPVTLGAVLRGCATLTDMSKGKQIHGCLIKSGFVLDIMVANSLLAMYAKIGSLDAANRFFGEMELKDTVSYSALISGCVQNGKAEDALVIFRKMQESKIEPDIATMVGILPACAHLSALESGRCNHSYLIVRGFASDTSIGNALIDMYSKCGRIEFARQVFDRMPNRDIISWNAIILGYGIHGLGTESLLLFQDLLSLGLKPDDVTFINLLSACSHAGLVPEGKYWFTAMNQDFSIIPRIAHYICMVDLLGRGGLLDEAYDFIKKMSFDPDVRIWGALLGACRVHGNIELGEEVSNKIQMLGPEGTGNFVLLSNIYSAAGRWDDAAQVRIVQRDKGFKKSPGCSWIEINRSVHAFVGGDKSHLQSAWIYEKLEELLVEMKKLGYRADTSFVLQDVEEEEKERVLLYHSEKLAIAFGILSLSPSKPIFVTKNLRVCGDCHSAIKFISKITNRAITVRDATRFHHFRGGSCNCGDFW